MSASEQTSASKREAGYYWVNRKGYWSIAEFTPNAEDGIWFHTGSRLTHFGDYHWTEIDERRIERPSPQQQPDTDKIYVDGDFNSSYSLMTSTDPDKREKGKQLRIQELLLRINQLEAKLKGQPAELSKAQEREHHTKYVIKQSYEALRISNNIHDRDTAAGRQINFAYRLMLWLQNDFKGEMPRWIP